MRGIRCLFLFSLMGGNVSAQDEALVNAPRRTILDRPASIELVLDGYGRPSVMVTINESGPWRFAVDWGANALVVTDSVVEAARLPTRAEGISGAVSRSVDVRSVELDGVRFEGLVAAVAELPSGIHGILGFNVFAELLMTFDFPAGRLILDRGHLGPPDGLTTLELATPDAARLAYLGIPPDATTGAEGVQPHVSFTIGDLDGSAVLDTQATGYLYLPDSLADLFTTTGQSQSLVGRGPVMGNMSMQRVRVSETMRVGAYTTTDPIVTFRDRPGPMVGMAFLGQFIVSLDQRQNLVRFSAPNTDLVIPPQPWETESSPVEDFDKSAYVGVYGNREVTLANDTLFLQRLDAPASTPSSGRRISAPKLAMAPLGPDRFGLVQIPEALIEFVRSGGTVVAIRMRNPSGEWEEARRSN